MGGRSIAITLNYPVEIHGNLKGSATTWTTTSVFCKLLKFYVRDEVGEGEGGDDETEITVVSRAVRVARFVRPVLRRWVRSAWVLGGTRRGGWVLGRFSLASERALLCGLSHRQSQHRAERCKALFSWDLASTHAST